MKQNLQYLPEPHTYFTVRLALDSPLDVVALLGVSAIIAFAAWWFAVKRRRR